MLDLLRNSISSVRQCVFDKESHKLDLRKTSIESTNIVCASSLLITNEKASYRETKFFLHLRFLAISFTTNAIVTITRTI